MIREFTFTVPQEIIFGVGSFSRLPELLKKSKASKAFIISDRYLEQLGVIAKAAEIIEQSGMKSEVFLDVEANPSCETVEIATGKYKESGSDFIVAIGGGSPIDVAKAVGVLNNHGGKITDYEGPHKVPGKIVPIAAIPTTAGTGSETTPFVVITDVSRNYKLTVFSYETIPAYALLDPELITTLPPHIAASTGIDALVHGIESYLSKWASPFSDSMGEKAMELIGKNIRAFVADRSDIEAASAMMAGSMFGGIAFGWARLGNAHAMAHPLGGYFNIPHGVANAILLPNVLEFNALADKGRYEKIYNHIKVGGYECHSGFVPEMLVEEVRRMNRSLFIPEKLSYVGAKADKIHVMAVDAMKSGNVLVNPRHTTLEDIEALYEKTM